MTQVKLHITDERMLKLLDICTQNNLKGVHTIKDWCDSVGISNGNISNIRNGMQKFTKEHIHNACVHYNIASDYIFGFTESMFRVNNNIQPIDYIRQGIIELEKQTYSKKKVSKTVTK